MEDASCVVEGRVLAADDAGPWEEEDHAAAVPDWCARATIPAMGMPAIRVFFLMTFTLRRTNKNVSLGALKNF